MRAGSGWRWHPDKVFVSAVHNPSFVQRSLVNPPLFLINSEASGSARTLDREDRPVQSRVQGNLGALASGNRPPSISARSRSALASPKRPFLRHLGRERNPCLRRSHNRYLKLRLGNPRLQSEETSVPASIFSETELATLHALRRFLFFAHEGKVQRRQADQQTNQILCLNLVTNAPSSPGTPST